MLNTAPDMAAIYDQAKRTAERLLATLPKLRFVAARGDNSVALNAFNGTELIASATCVGTSVSVLAHDGYRSAGKLTDLYQIVLSAAQNRTVTATVEPGPDAAFIGSFIRSKINNEETLVCIDKDIDATALYAIQDAKFIEMAPDGHINSRCFLEISGDLQVYKELIRLAHFRIQSLAPHIVNARKTRYVEIILSTHASLQGYKLIHAMTFGLLSSGSTLYFKNDVLSLMVTLGSQDNFRDVVLEDRIKRRAIDDVKRIQTMLNGFHVYRVESSYKVVSRL